MDLIPDEFIKRIDEQVKRVCWNLNTAKEKCFEKLITKVSDPTAEIATKELENVLLESARRAQERRQRQGCEADARIASQSS